MIKSSELNKIANKEGVRQQQIEKDYMISWILWGISNHTLLNKVLAFKGGTCLKKIYFENYRYSEDMDFTLVSNGDNILSNDDIFLAFSDLFIAIKEEANIDLTIPENSKEIHESSGSLKFYINYVGPLRGNGDHVKVDLTKGEKLEFDTVYKKVLHQYSDLEELGEDFNVQSYHINEVVIEKMTALMGRTVPRDLYDFDYLTNFEGLELQNVYYEFERKAAHKGHNPKEFVEKVSKKIQIFESSWNENLSHQVKDLPKFKDVWRDVNKQFRILEKIK
jgi:predicted nucleotidyltransferase component of viral defense system